MRCYTAELTSDTKSVAAMCLNMNGCAGTFLPKKLCDGLRVQNSPQNKLALCPPALNRPCRPPGMQIVDSRRKVSTTLVSFPLVAPLQSDTRYMPSKMCSARHVHTTSSSVALDGFGFQVWPIRKSAKYLVFVVLALGAGHTPQDPSLHRVHAITQT